MSQPAPEFQIIVALLTAVNEQQEQITRLSEQVSKLEAENKELSDRLNTNSRSFSALCIYQRHVARPSTGVQNGSVST